MSESISYPPNLEPEDPQKCVNPEWGGVRHFDAHKQEESKKGQIYIAHFMNDPL